MAEMSEAELEELERKANGATQVEWKWSSREIVRVGGMDFIYIPQGSMLGDTLITLSDTYENCGHDCDHIAAFSPPVCLRLIAEIRRLHRENADNAEWRKEFKAQRDSLIDVVNQMQKQVRDA